MTSAGPPRTMRDLVAQLGIPDAEVERAIDDGTLGLLAISSFIFPGEPVYDADDMARLTDLGPMAARYWRALGFPDAAPGEPAFTQADLDVLMIVKRITDIGLVEEDVALQMARAIGVSMARIAAAQIDAVEARMDEVGADAVFGSGELIDGEDPAVLRAGMLQTTMPQILEYAWRRHMQVAALRRMIRDAAVEAGGSAAVAVGFADLVGFTALAQQLDEHELAAVVERFEQTAYDVVGANGGRVVKMIGDEVLYLVDDPAVAVDIGMQLADAYHADDALSDVRVGIAYGAVVERAGDIFGPTVNLASRIVGLAYEGSVVTSEAVHDALADEPGLRWKQLRSRHLKNIGREHLWTVRAVHAEGGDSEDDLEERAWRRRGAIRNRMADVVERIGDLAPGRADLEEEE